MALTCNDERTRDVMRPFGPCDPGFALRQLCAEPAAAFGERLLARADGASISFRVFVQCARELVAANPDDAARWIAAMVALDMYDMRRDDERTETCRTGVN